MASTILRSAGRALSRSIPRALEQQHPSFPRFLAQAPRLFSSDRLGRTEPIEHSYSRPVARLDESGHKGDTPEGMTPRDELIYMELDRIEKAILKDGKILDQIQAAVTEKNERDEMYYRRKAGFVGAAAVASGVAGVAVLAKTILFG